MSDELETFLKAVIGLGLVALLFVAITSIAGCNQPNGGCIGDVPCDEQVTDECVPEIIETFCPACDLDSAYNEGYGDGFGAASDLCEGNREECPEPVECPEPPSCDSYGDDVPRGHLPKECRGKHRAAAPKCDRNCDPNDPICIPCDLELARRVCRTVCNTTPYVGTECTTQCWEDGRPV